VANTLLCLMLRFICIGKLSHVDCVCSVFEAFGKIRSCKLAPDMLRPGKHRQVNLHELFYDSMYPYCPTVIIFYCKNRVTSYMVNVLRSVVLQKSC